MANVGRVIHKDPAGVRRGVILKRPLFDNSPHRNVGNPMQRAELEAVPDDLLIATLVDNGQPAWAAAEVRRSPMARFNALRFWCDVQDAAEGNLEAKARVDYARSMWSDMRQTELIADRPDMSIGLWER